MNKGEEGHTTSHTDREETEVPHHNYRPFTIIVERRVRTREEKGQGATKNAVYVYAVWLWYTLTMTQHWVWERHNSDGCLQVALTARLHCTAPHRHMDEGLCLFT